MSAFLGPIHYWLYNKIQIQQSLVMEVLSYGEKQISGIIEIINAKYGLSETRPLGEVINQDNIHGWLQEQVEREEGKLAEGVTRILNSNPEHMDALLMIFRKKGKSLSKDFELFDAPKTLGAISDCLLDGMPCDRANMILIEESSQVLWKRNVCVHSDYWVEAGGDIRIYYTLREELIKGFLEESDFEFRTLANGEFEIRRIV